jgi:hypothetical protein
MTIGRTNERNGEGIWEEGGNEIIVPKGSRKRRKRMRD